MTSENSSARGWALALAALAAFTVALDALVTATALTSIQRSFDASLAQLQWTSNAYNLAFAVLLSVGAALGDRFGRKRMYIIGLAAFVVASIACALSNSIETLIAARALQGAGAAMVMPMTLAIVSVAYPAEMRGKALGIFGSIMGLAPLSGPAIGGIISQQLHWSWIFWINLPIVVILIGSAALRLKESYGPPRRVDVRGITLIAGLSFAAAWALMRGNEVGWTSIEVVGSVIIAIILLGALIVWLNRSQDPVIPPHLFRSRGFGGGLLTAFLLYGGLYSTLFFITQFLQVAQGYGPMEAGLRLLPWTATLFVVAPISGSLINRVGERLLVVLGLSINAIGLAVLALNASVEMSFASMAPALVLMGVGVSMAMPSLQSGILRNIAPADLGKASGAFSMSQFLGGMFGIAVMACVFSSLGSYANAGAFADGFRGVATATAIMVALGAVIGLSLSRGARSPVGQISATG